MYINNLRKVAIICISDRTAYAIIILGVVIGMFMMLYYVGLENLTIAFTAWFWWSLLASIVLIIIDILLYIILGMVIFVAKSGKKDNSIEE
ncbi:MAG: hypothetical protein KAI67_02015 [Candidatus Pacebacteria bacterium]|nr:hypothetical protein [Candidatus Paceibacterota bacterium]